MMQERVPGDRPQLSPARRALAAALAVTLALCSSVSLAEAPGTSPQLDAELAKLVDLYSDGLSYDRLEWRHVANGPLFDDDKPAAVAFFTLAGVDLTNSYRKYMAILARGAGRGLSKAGAGRNARSIWSPLRWSAANGAARSTGRPSELAAVPS
ncbi:hypothetical protein [Stakelama marina]|uniref:Uncharacterized protein n=1 Tax=Stakelama marina TaxID=2826939 RepID=A0A8T4I979_9SPHN|nr:hypothetical protein [Stakelama marina]MBR0550883.1 hypothetical protein [Stakelama marina]